MAQLVEQRIRNAWVAGSSPAIGSLRHYFGDLTHSCGISTSVVHGLPKPGRRVRFPYSAHKVVGNCEAPYSFYCHLCVLSQSKRLAHLYLVVRLQVVHLVELL